MNPKQGIFKGEIFNINNGESVKVERYLGSSNILVSFIGEYVHTKNVSSHQLKSGNIKNNYKPSVVGIGFLGEGLYKTSSKGKKTRCYLAWVGMLTRCYTDRAVYKKYFGVCTVHPDWHNFQDFAEWYYSQKGFDKRFHLDKDLIVKDNKVYSPKTCCLLPHEMNTVLITSDKDSELPCGVTIARSGRLCSRISISNKTTQIGFYDTVGEASCAYVKRKEEEVRNMGRKWKNQISTVAYEKSQCWVVYE